MMINHDVNSTGYFTEAEDLAWLATCGVASCVVGDSVWVTDQNQVKAPEPVEVEISDI